MANIFNVALKSVNFILTRILTFICFFNVLHNLFTADFDFVPVYFFPILFARFWNDWFLTFEVWTPTLDCIVNFIAYQYWTYLNLSEESSSVNHYYDHCHVIFFDPLWPRLWVTQCPIFILVYLFCCMNFNNQMG